MTLLEVCCGNFASVEEAVRGGAKRIELCSALEKDGLTPDWEALRQARAQYPGLTIHVLIRPREGNFVYTPEEQRQMADAIRTALKLGADGLVFGCLDREGQVDLEAMRPLMDAAGSTPVTFHRAFDVCREPFRALEEIIGLGCRRILTSGQAPKAAEGTDLIRALNRRAAGRILLMPGSGVQPANAARILRLTHCREIHGSATLGGSVTSAATVAAILQTIQSSAMYQYTPVQGEENRYVVSLDNHVNILEALTAFCEEKDILAGEVEGLGAIGSATFRFLNPATKKYVDKSFEEQMEITNLTGNISQKEGKVYLHVHITASRSDYSCIGGHLLEARVNGACELLVTAFPGTQLGRRPDEETGLNLYQF